MCDDINGTSEDNQYGNIHNKNTGYFSNRDLLLGDPGGNSHTSDTATRI